MNPMWLILILVTLPFLAYFTVKFGAYGYFKAKSLAQRKEVEPTPNDNS